MDEQEERDWLLRLGFMPAYIEAYMRERRMTAEESAAAAAEQARIDTARALGVLPQYFRMEGEDRHG